MENKVDVEKLKHIIEDSLRAYNASVKMKEKKDEKTYMVNTKEAKLVITISNKWIGYDLEVNAVVLGKKIGTFADTDNYSIHGEFADISLKIFDEVIACLNALLEGRIYCGTFRGKPTLAVPINGTTYKVIIRKNRFTGQSLTFKKQELKQIDNLQSVL